ncbi:SBE2 [Candida margitis]|uniref:SBE2 n=1 Tax=Candida margitis TaxID=1775924 RepID=UPI002225DD94|nr:SBE2 [Candida margitis]KAI5952180.1 SBE2 [Candida margitis]
MSNTTINSHNLYDISLNTRKSSCPSVPPPPSKMGGGGGTCPTPKRVASRTSLPTLNEHIASVPNIPKRPGDYYIQKINSKSSLNLNKSQPLPNPAPSSASATSLPTNNRRRMSQDSLMSVQSSSSSFEDHSSIVSSPFDAPVASTSSAITSSTTQSQHNHGSQPPLPTDSRLSSMTSSSSTTAFESKVSLVDNDSTISLAKTPSNFKPRALKAASTTNVLKTFPVPQPPPKKERSKSVTTVPTLNRSKSKFLSSQESKERQMLRKKKYEENDHDEEILSTDLDSLIFNVPVIKNNELYSLQKGSSTNLGKSKSRSNSGSSSTVTILSRNDLVGDDNDKYNIRPCPLPGKLSTTNLPTVHANNEDSIIEEDESTFDDDSEITANISDFYSQKSASVSKLIKMTREQNLMYKLPSFIKSQSSLEDLHLISPEKLNFLDQTRPINLPPKSSVDITKHNREFTKSLSSFETIVKTQHDSRIKTVQTALLHQQQWIKNLDSLMDLDTKQFNKKFTSEKNQLRKLAWDCNVPASLAFQFLLKILSNNYSSQDSINTIRNSFELFDQKLQGLTEVMKQSKNREFNKIMDSVLSKPLIASSGVDMSQFQTNFIHLLYIKSMSETGLSEKDHSTIPIILVMFPHQSVIDIYCLLELINQEIFNREFTSSYKAPSGETSELTFNDTFRLMLQFNDSLPLSLSAPSTPIVDQGKFEPLDDNAKDQDQDQNGTNFVHTSASIEIVTKLLTLLVVNSQSTKTKLKNNSKLIKSFIKTIFINFHIGWNSYDELVKMNKSIRINNCSDQRLNLEKFVARWTSNHFG